MNTWTNMTVLQSLLQNPYFLPQFLLRCILNLDFLLSANAERVMFRTYTATSNKADSWNVFASGWWEICLGIYWVFACLQDFCSPSHRKLLVVLCQLHYTSPWAKFRFSTCSCHWPHVSKEQNWTFEYVCHLWLTLGTMKTLFYSQREIRDQLKRGRLVATIKMSFALSPECD